MKIIYLVTCKSNPLYYGAYVENGVYKTFGQHSFIYDFFCTALEQGIKIELATDDTDAFPLSHVFSNHRIPIHDLNKKLDFTADIIIIDTLHDALLKNLKLEGYKVGIIHNYLIKQPDFFYAFCDKVVCLTLQAKKEQEHYAVKDNLICLHQGIHVKRFEALASGPEIHMPCSVLIYSRMDRFKGEIYAPIIDYLVQEGYDVSIMGDGEYFREYTNRYTERITAISYVPCFSIHRFIPKFNVIISNGRGVMEAMSAGKPTIAAGVKYCGLITQENIERFWHNNFTGSFLTENHIRIEEDMHKIALHQYDDPRRLALQYFDNNNFVKSIVALRP